MLELEANVNDLTEVQQQMSSDENAVSSEARKRLTEQLERGQKLESTLQKSQQQVEELETKLQVMNYNLLVASYHATDCPVVYTQFQVRLDESKVSHYRTLGKKFRWSGKLRVQDIL